MKKKVTLKDISEKVGVSRGTVDRALHDRGRIDIETRKRILACAKEMGYEPNSIARALVKQYKLRIAVVIPKSPDYFFSIIEDGINDAIRDEAARGVEIYAEYFYTKDVSDWTRQTQIFKKIRGNKFDGIIAVPQNSAKVTRYIDDFVEDGVEVVTVNNDAPRSRRLCYVGEDSLMAGRIAGELMSKLVDDKGSVAVLTGSNLPASMKDRTKGFKSFFRQNKIDMEMIGPFEYGEKESTAYSITRDLIKERDDLKGICLTTTTGLVSTARAVIDSSKAGKIKIIGPDMSEDIRRLMQQDVIQATIYQSPKEQGFTALKVLSGKLSFGVDPESDVIHTRLSVLLKEIAEAGAYI